MVVDFNSCYHCWCSLHVVTLHGACFDKQQMPFESNAAVTVSSASVPRARLCLSHVSVPHARTFCIKCVSVGQRSLRHMQSAHALGGFSPRAWTSTSNTPAQMKVRGVTLKPGEKTELEVHASPKKRHALGISIGSLRGTTQVTWAARMWVWGVCVVLSVGWGVQVLIVRPYTQWCQDLFWILHYRLQHSARARPETILHRQRYRQREGTAESTAHLTELRLYFALISCFVCSTRLFPLWIGIYDFFHRFRLIRHLISTYAHIQDLNLTLRKQL